MNILVLNYEFPPLGGGASPISYSLAKGYAQAGHQVDVVTMRFKGLKKQEKKDGMTIYRVPCLRRKKEMTTFIELFSYILPAISKSLALHKKNNYDVCHCHFALPTGMVAFVLKKLTSLPYIITLHGSDVPGYNSDRFQFIHKLTRPFFKSILLNAKHVISGSKYLSKLLQKHITIKTEIIPNAVDTTDFKPGKKEKIILAAGRFQPLKGFQHLIEAVSKEKNWPVYLAGAGPYEDELKTLAENSKTEIRFLGWQSKEDMKQLYAKASIFVLPSEKENSSLALLEAMSAGCAIITTKSTGSPELVSYAGKLVKYGSPLQIRNSINKIKKDLKKYKQNSLLRSKELDIKNITKKMLSLLK